jgi:hypothetical protein
MKLLRYLAALVYWSIWHRSVALGRWCAEYETAKGPANHGEV